MKGVLIAHKPHARIGSQHGRGSKDVVRQKPSRWWLGGLTTAFRYYAYVLYEGTKNGMREH